MGKFNIIRMDSIEVIRHVSLDELKVLIRKESNKNVHERLLFIYQLYTGAGVQEAYKRMCVSEQTGYNWLKQWNEGGPKELAPEFGGGRPPKLDKNKREQLKQKLSEKNNWMTSEVKALIKKEFKVKYSDRHVARILRGFKMHYAKPYPNDYRQPENAEELLKQSIKSALVDAPKDFVVGFIDQASPQTSDNKQRFWSFDKPRIVKNTAKYRANTFGFYPMNGKEVIDFKERSTIQQVCEFLLDIQYKNPLKHIFAFLDNASAHVSEKTKSFAASHSITLIFLPTYSPKLNPIEYIWKSIRKKISQVFVKSERTFQETIRTTFHHLAKKDTFTAGWLKKFGHLFPNLL